MTCTCSLLVSTQSASQASLAVSMLFSSTRHLISSRASSASFACLTRFSPIPSLPMITIGSSMFANPRRYARCLLVSSIVILLLRFLIQIVRQRRLERAQRIAAVGDCGALFQRHLCKGLSLVRHEEYRVVAKAVVAHRRIRNGAVAIAVRAQNVAVRKRAGDGRMKTGAAVGLPLHHLKKEHIAPPVVQSLAAEARAVDAGSAVERVNAQTRIVCDGRKPRRLHHGLRLEQRVLGKGLAGLLDLALHAELCFGNDLHAETGEHLFQLLQLFHILCSQDKFHIRSLLPGVAFSALFLF